MHKILKQLLNTTFTYNHQISCKTTVFSYSLLSNASYRLIFYRSSGANHWGLRSRLLLSSWMGSISINHKVQSSICLAIACWTISNLGTATTNRLRVHFWAHPLPRLIAEAVLQRREGFAFAIASPKCRKRYVDDFNVIIKEGQVSAFHHLHRTFFSSDGVNDGDTNKWQITDGAASNAPTSTRISVFGSESIWLDPLSSDLCLRVIHR